MSPDRSGNLLHLLNMIESCAKIRRYATGFADAESFFAANEQLQYNACLALLLNIGESVGKLSPEIPILFPLVEWDKLRGLRNRVAHDYPGLDVFVVFGLVTRDVPGLETSLYGIVAAELAGGAFDPDEWEAARGSAFYRHVDFTRCGP